jgi:uncharacterized protein YndB with AHSA1/START domain
MAVYNAFAAPQVLASWWGPDGFTNRFEVFEFQVGGRWLFTMHGPDGACYANHNQFVDLQPGARVVIRHVSQPHFTLTVGLAPAPGGTALTWHQRFDDANTAQAVAHIVVPANEQNLDRLTQALALVARRPVWAALSTMFLDADVSLGREARAQALAASGLPDHELQQILINEVYPACWHNLGAVDGQKQAFDAAWLQATIVQGLAAPSPSWARLQALAAIAVPDSDEWLATLAALAQLRGQASQA